MQRHARDLSVLLYPKYLCFSILADIPDLRFLKQHPSFQSLLYPQTSHVQALHSVNHSCSLLRNTLTSCRSKCFRIKVRIKSDEAHLVQNWEAISLVIPPLPCPLLLSSQNMKPSPAALPSPFDPIDTRLCPVQALGRTSPLSTFPLTDSFSSTSFQLDHFF